MRAAEAAALVVIAALLILIFYFATAKGDRKKISIINEDGSRVSVDAEIANSIATRTKGLMGRSSLGQSEGMLFIFDSPGVYSFWMLNTTIPLEAIHISDNGTVVDIIEMDPCGLNVTNCKLYPPSKPARYVLEVNQNFSKTNDIAIGKSKLNLSSLYP